MGYDTMDMGYDTMDMGYDTMDSGFRRRSYVHTCIQRDVTTEQAGVSEILVTKVETTWGHNQANKSPYQ